MDISSSSFASFSVQSSASFLWLEAAASDSLSISARRFSSSAAFFFAFWIRLRRLRSSACSSFFFRYAVFDAVSDSVFRLPKVDESVASVAVATVLQLYAYHAAVARGCSVDQPRNLAKSVTVE